MLTDSIASIAWGLAIPLEGLLPTVIITVVFVVLAYFVVMRVFFQRSREADKKVDYSKIRPWKDDED